MLIIAHVPAVDRLIGLQVMLNSNGNGQISTHGSDILRLTSLMSSSSGCGQIVQRIQEQDDEYVPTIQHRLPIPETLLGAKRPRPLEDANDDLPLYKRVRLRVQLNRKIEDTLVRRVLASVSMWYCHRCGHGPRLREYSNICLNGQCGHKRCDRCKRETIIQTCQ